MKAMMTAFSADTIVEVALGPIREPSRIPRIQMTTAKVATVRTRSWASVSSVLNAWLSRWNSGVAAKTTLIFMRTANAETAPTAPATPGRETGWMVAPTKVRRSALASAIYCFTAAGLTMWIPPLHFSVLCELGGVVHRPPTAYEQSYPYAGTLLI